MNYFKTLIRILLVSSLFIIPLKFSFSGQTNTRNQFNDVYFKAKYDSILNSDQAFYSERRMLARAKQGNSYYLTHIGYFVNSNNMMFQATDDKKYLGYNYNVIRSSFNNELSKSGLPSTWIVKVSEQNQNYHINGEESPLFEGYFMRYVAEFVYLLKENNISEYPYQDILSALENSFQKWETRSLNRYNDLYHLYRTRIHMGAQWATASLFLYQVTGKDKYLQIYNTFNQEVKNNLTWRLRNFRSLYVWNSTYKRAFTPSLRGLNENPVIQDVSHGNHVVQFIIDSYKVGMGNWKYRDIIRLSNTVKYNIWDNDKKNFSDYVTGKDAAVRRDIGWQQSDGWMKLMEYDPQLKDIYLTYYQDNQSKIDDSFLNIQFYAVYYKALKSR